MMNNKPEHMLKERPRIAIVDPNTLAILGLKQILQNVLPIMQVDTFNTFAELKGANPQVYFHYFVATSVVIENRTFFLEHKNKTIVLTASTEPNSQMAGFNSLCINVPEEQLVRSILQLEQYAHAHGRNFAAPTPCLTDEDTIRPRDRSAFAHCAGAYQ